MLPLLAITFYPLWSIIFLVLLIGCCSWAEFAESESGTALITIAGLIGLYFITTPSGAAYTWMGDNLVGTAFYIAAYFGIGAVYSVVKWWRYLLNRIDKFKEQNTPDSYNYTSRLEDFIAGTPTFTRRKSLISLWIGYWPVSVVWTLINDPITKLINFIFSQLRGMYESIAQHVFKDLNAELKTLKAAEKK